MIQSHFECIDCYPLFSTVIRYCQLISVYYPLWPTVQLNPQKQNFDSWSNRARNLHPQLLLSGEKEQSEVWNLVWVHLILVVDPPVHPSFWRGCRRATSTNDPANERARACHKGPSFKNIGLGGRNTLNRALNSSESVCIPVYIYINTTDVTFSKKRMPTSWPQCGFAAINLWLRR